MLANSIRSPRVGWLYSNTLISQAGFGLARLSCCSRTKDSGRHVIRARDLESEAIGLVLDVAVVRQGERRGDEEAEVEQQQQERQRRDVAQRLEADPRAVPGDDGAGREVNAKERQQNHDGEHRDELPHVAEHVVAHLVAHDEEQLRLVQALDDRVPQHDPLRGAEAGDVRVQRVGVGALVHLVDAAACNPRAIGQLQDARLERLVLHRAERVEQRIDPDRLDDDHEQQERHRRQSGVEPPAAGALAQQEVGNPEKERAGDDADDQRDQRVGEPLLERLVRQAVRVIADELLVVRARQVDDEGQDREDGEVDRDDEEPLAPDARGPVAHPRREPGHEHQPRQHEAPDRVDDPEHDAASVALHRQRRGLGHRDGSRVGVGRLRLRARGRRGGRRRRRGRARLRTNANRAECHEHQGRRDESHAHRVSLGGTARILQCSGSSAFGTGQSRRRRDTDRIASDTPVVLFPREPPAFPVSFWLPSGRFAIGFDSPSVPASEVQMTPVRDRSLHAVLWFGQLVMAAVFALLRLRETDPADCGARRADALGHRRAADAGDVHRRL